jgi:hypothetical protein
LKFLRSTLQSDQWRLSCSSTNRFWKASNVELETNIRPRLRVNSSEKPAPDFFIVFLHLTTFAFRLTSSLSILFCGLPFCIPSSLLRRPFPSFLKPSAAMMCHRAIWKQESLWSRVPLVGDFRERILGGQVRDPDCVPVA